MRLTGSILGGKYYIAGWVESSYIVTRDQQSRYHAEGGKHV